LPQLGAIWSVHCISGSWPAGTVAQVPTVPGSAHEAHVPAHAVAQQTFCWQKLCAHSPGIVQGWPSASLPQLILTQLLVVTQSALVAQVVRQVGVAVLQRYGSQSELVTDRQTPAPSHVRCGVSVEPTQVAAAHCVLVPQERHAPAPLHIPSVPQVVDTVVAHCVVGLGALPLGTLVHVPRLPAIAHDLHVPVHA